jgi:hypothetical protein
MRALLAALLLTLAAQGARAETINLREHGRLEIFPVGEWNIRSEDDGDLKIQIVPKGASVNAACQIIVAAGGADDFSTRGKLTRQVTDAGRRMIATGDFVETEVTVKTFYCKQGFGFYFTLTDPKLVGKESVKGDYKQVSLGMIRVNSSVMIRVQILSEGEQTEPFQQLLGMVEGMELSGK